MLEHVPTFFSEEINAYLVSPQNMEEIRSIMFSFLADKAPGPNGFYACFYQHFWDVIGKDLCKIIGYSLKRLCMGNGINSSFLSFVPKESNPSYFSRFCLIYLCNVSYNIISKLLASRIRKILVHEDKEATNFSCSNKSKHKVSKFILWVVFLAIILVIVLNTVNLLQENKVC